MTKYVTEIFTFVSGNLKSELVIDNITSRLFKHFLFLIHQPATNGSAQSGKSGVWEFPRDKFLKKLITLLIGEDANINAMDSRGNTAFMVAAMNRHP